MGQINYPSFEALIFIFQNQDLNFPLLSRGNLASSMFEKERRFQISHEDEASKFRVVILTHLYEFGPYQDEEFGYPKTKQLIKSNI